MQEIKICKNCNREFTIESEDFEYYKKVGVPAPAMCPDCRHQLRLMFRNERTFYKRPCSKCGKDIVSVYSPNKTFPVWCRDCYLADDWDALTYGQVYDPSKSFFDQVDSLFRTVPRVSLFHINSINSELQTTRTASTDTGFKSVGIRSTAHMDIRLNFLMIRTIANNVTKYSIPRVVRCAVIVTSFLIAEIALTASGV
jgi:DNA-directed RNA polymerase subunit RPC12/RpoP